MVCNNSVLHYFSESTTGPLNALANQHLSVPPNLGGPQGMTSPSFTQPQKPRKDPPPTSSPQHNSSSEQNSPASKRKQTATATTNSNKSSPDKTKAKADIVQDRRNGDRDNKVVGNNVIQDIPHSNDLYKADTNSASGSYGSRSEEDSISKGGKLMGSVALYDDLEVSSSDETTPSKDKDKAAAAQASRFKMWGGGNGNPEQANSSRDSQMKKSNSNSKFKMWSKGGDNAVAGAVNRQGMDGENKVKLGSARNRQNHNHGLVSPTQEQQKHPLTPTTSTPTKSSDSADLERQQSNASNCDTSIGSPAPGGLNTNLDTSLDIASDVTFDVHVHAPIATGSINNDVGSVAAAVAWGNEEDGEVEEEEAIEADENV